VSDCACSYKFVGEPVCRNFEYVRGASFLRTYTLTHNDNTPVDLTGKLIAGQIGTVVASGAIDVVLAFTAVITDALNGKFSISLTHNDTLTLSPFKGYQYDVFFYTADGLYARPILSGSFNPKQNVTAFVAP
jgi:hypothetical protein